MNKSGSNVICSRCGKEFYKSKFQISITKNNYCSLECYRQGNRKYNEIKIIGNGEAFVICENGNILINESDIEKVKNICWLISTNGYAYSKKHKLLMHRLITDCPRDKVVDHINHNQTDNRRCNLKVCTQRENCQNRIYQTQSTTNRMGVLI